MVIRIKRAYEPASAEDGRRFLVDRFWPRGIKRDTLAADAWLKEVSPSAELCKWFAHDPDRWEEFERRYRQELQSRADMLEPLLEAARKGDVTLVYGARDERHNQALVLRKVLEERLR